MSSVPSENPVSSLYTPPGSVPVGGSLPSTRTSSSANTSTHPTSSLISGVFREPPPNTSSVCDVEWRHVQAFGDDNSADDDLVTAVEFDHSGNYLAVGDKAGRICVFEASSFGESYRDIVGEVVDNNPHMPFPQRKHRPGAPSTMAIVTGDNYGSVDDDVERDRVLQRVVGADTSDVTNTLPKALEYKFYSEFQSHEPNFDCLKSTEIDARINSVKWVSSTPSSQFILATNDKTVKLWKLYDKHTTVVTNNTGVNTHGDVLIPQTAHMQTVTTATKRRVFSDAHLYHINSISPIADGETFISSDDVQIHMWNYEYPNEGFNVVNIKPSNMEEITEVITSSHAHPHACNLFVYSSSRGCVRLVDLRDSAICDTQARTFETEEDPLFKSFFSEITASLTDAKFSPDGRYIIARDFLNVTVWDTHMENKPVATYKVHDYLRLHMCDLYENDCLFDKFRLSCSPDGSQILTGSYHNHFSVHHKNGTTLQFEAGAKSLKKKAKNNKTGRKSTTQRKERTSESPNIALMDFSRRALHVAWHPKLDCIAVAGVNKLYLYQAFAPSSEEML